MVIVTMATEGYLDWLHHFICGLEGNTVEKILVNLINLPSKKAQFLKQQFPNILFKSHRVEAEARGKNNPEGKCFKVTYLKGKFVNQAFKKFKEPVLWIDVTALIRSDVSEITDKFTRGDVLLMRRDYGKAEGKSVYACEIFGINSAEEATRYEKLCGEHDKDWYSDQLALCKLQGKKHPIEFGRWSNFYYDQEAASWSDRGRTGAGTLNMDDVNFTHDKFIEDLESRHPGYSDKYLEFMGRISNRKILIHVDDSDWCYATTVKEVMKISNFDVTVIYNVSHQRNELLAWKGDLVWGRCGSYRHKKLLEIRPDLRAISFSTITTGGDSLFSRFYRQMADGKGEAGVIVQNNEAKSLVDHFIKKSKSGQKCFVLPNGVNTKKFKQKKHHDREDYIVGFVGRSKEESEKQLKGINYVDYCSDMAGLKTMIASNTAGTQVPFEEMPDFYQKIDVLLLPSNSEGCSNTINEAMASGIPVITPEIGWHSDVCQNMEIFWAKRNAAEIYDALEYFKDPRNRMEYGAAARVFANEHSWPIMLKYYEEIFNHMITQARANKKKILSEVQKVPDMVIKTGPIIKGKFIKVRALKKVNLGKLEINGPVLWFVPGQTRTIPDDEEHRKTIDYNVQAGFLEIAS